MFAGLKPVIYAQVSAQRLTLRNVKSGETISEVPDVALSASAERKILRIGAEARVAASAQGGEVVNPFPHPRSMISDYGVAEKLLRVLLRRLHAKSLFALAPLLTEPERRAFREMATAAGASQAIVWMGRVLTDEEALSRNFPPDGAWE